MSRKPLQGEAFNPYKADLTERVEAHLLLAELKWMKVKARL